MFIFTASELLNIHEMLSYQSLTCYLNKHKPLGWYLSSQLPTVWHCPDVSAPGAAIRDNTVYITFHAVTPIYDFLPLMTYKLQCWPWLNDMMQVIYKVLFNIQYNIMSFFRVKLSVYEDMFVCFLNHNWLYARSFLSNLQELLYHLAFCTSLILNKY